MAVKRFEYFVNKYSMRSHPERNHIHIRPVGSVKSLCGQTIDPEFDSSQIDKWEKIENPTRKKICKSCRKHSKKVRDPRDLQVIKALQITTEIEENPEFSSTLIAEKDVISDFEELLECIGATKTVAKNTLTRLVKEYISEDNPNLLIILKMNAIKEFIKACNSIKSN